MKHFKFQVQESTAIFPKFKTWENQKTENSLFKQQISS